jgi:hypothetical protein
MMAIVAGMRHSKPQKIIRNQNYVNKYTGSVSSSDVCGSATIDVTFGDTIDPGGIYSFVMHDK